MPVPKLWSSSVSRGTAKQSGAGLAISAAHVLTLRDGRIARTDVFLDRADALEVAGMSE